MADAALEVPENRETLVWYNHLVGFSCIVELQFADFNVHHRREIFTKTVMHSDGTKLEWVGLLGSYAEEKSPLERKLEIIIALKSVGKLREPITPWLTGDVGSDTWLVHYDNSTEILDYGDGVRLGNIHPLTVQTMDGSPAEFRIHFYYKQPRREEMSSTVPHINLMKNPFDVSVDTTTWFPKSTDRSTTFENAEFE